MSVSPSMKMVPLELHHLLSEEILSTNHLAQMKVYLAKEEEITGVNKIRPSLVRHAKIGDLIMFINITITLMLKNQVWESKQDTIIAETQMVRIPFGAIP